MKIQKNLNKIKKKIGSAEDNPETAGPSENLREEALEETDKQNTENEPA